MLYHKIWQKVFPLKRVFNGPPTRSACHLLHGLLKLFTYWKALKVGSFESLHLQITTALLPSVCLLSIFKQCYFKINSAFCFSWSNCFAPCLVHSKIVTFLPVVLIGAGVWPAYLLPVNFTWRWLVRHVCTLSQCASSFDMQAWEGFRTHFKSPTCLAGVHSNRFLIGCPLSCTCSFNGFSVVRTVT